MKNNKNIKTITLDDFMKANRHGEWMALSENERGFVSKHKIHRSKKSYNRKSKHKQKIKT